MANVDTVESDESCVQTDIRFGEGGASEVALTGQDLLDSVESGKHLPHCLVVGLLLGGKTSTVDSIVDVPKYGMYGRFTLSGPKTIHTKMEFRLLLYVLYQGVIKPP